MMVYAAGAAGRAAYARARENAQPRRRPRDPQGTPLAGGPAAVAAVAVLMLPCATPVPGGACGSPALGHQIGARDGREVRTYCCLATAAGRCPCARYTPPDQAPGAGLSKLTKK